MIFEVISYRGKLLGEAGNRIINVLLETFVSKGFVTADDEATAAGRVGLVQVQVSDCESSLQEWFSRYYFAKGTSADEVMADLQKMSGWLNPSDGVLVYVISRIAELAEGRFAKAK